MSPVSLQSGFSLIELMMAIFIMALATSLVVMTLPPQPGKVESEAARIEAEMHRAADQAMVSGHMTGLDITRDGYAMVRWRSGGWQTISGTGYVLPEDISIDYASESDRKLPDDWPELRFDPLGPMTPAVITLVGSDKTLIIDVDAGMKTNVASHAR